MSCIQNMIMNAVQMYPTRRTP